ncbi:hypothetical protein GXM_03054 [Nostoc sphaeroides CCNUC1]|uniref:Uncharacterized protein n=1 Tax=Nostoc sphaeroides CCNUC1 TaxID=2653204 RepID=A0A5P8VYW2_9NOSO|nr:hypothetical protein GXM_03054 [Nostoc sphaeroides CCNUC1]
MSPTPQDWVIYLLEVPKLFCYSTTNFLLQEKTDWLYRSTNR